MFFCCLSYYSQTELTISGHITDAETGEPIQRCFVELADTSISIESDEKGFYRLRLSAPISSYKIKFTALNYEDYEIGPKKGIGIGEKRNDQFNVTLQFASYLLKDITISSAPDTVWGDEELNVADFAFHGNNTILLVYEYEQRWKKQEESKITLFAGCRLILLDHRGNELSRVLIPEYAVSLYTDFPDETFLIGRENKYYIDTTDDILSLIKIESEEFVNNIKPVIERKGNLLCLSSYNKDFPQFDYSILNRADSSYKQLHRICDEAQMTMFRSEYKYLGPKEKLEAFRFEVNTGIDKEIVAGFMTGYPNSIYYEPLNTPLFCSNDTLNIFDHVHHKIHRYTWDCEKVDSSSIGYHQRKKPEKWCEKIYRDHTSGSFYTAFQKNGFITLEKIDVRSGDVKKKTYLTYQYVEKIAVKKGYVYYIYRPFESSQNRFLYKEFLN